MKKISQILGAVVLLALALGSLACAGSSQTASAQLMSNITSPAPTVTPQAPEDNVPRIKAEEAIKLAQANNAIVVDTRDEGSFENMHVKGALNIPYRLFQEGKHQKLPKDKQLIFYCT